MRKLKLILEYDGTQFAGFQSQAAGIRTVQGTLGEAVEKITGEQVVIHAAGRTDAGVHALGQVAHFSTGSSYHLARMQSALNGVLPGDVSVRNAEWVGDEFHARFSASRRTYVYVILNRLARSAVWDRYSSHVTRHLDVDRMRKVARVLTGTNDFSSFASSGGNPGSTMVRRVEKLNVRRIGRNGDLVVMRCTANAFLRSMVRNFAGILIAAGHAMVEPDAARTVLEARDRAANPFGPAPPRGLCLVRVDYNDSPRIGATDLDNIDD